MSRKYGKLPQLAAPARNDTATDNAEELITKYTRLANSARQAEITQEITEIVAVPTVLRLRPVHMEKIEMTTTSTGQGRVAVGPVVDVIPAGRNSSAVQHIASLTWNLPGRAKVNRRSMITPEVAQHLWRQPDFRDSLKPTDGMSLRCNRHRYRCSARVGTSRSASQPT